ncbi:hypothetical protein ACFWIN_37405 [Streptomyces sp. NPDC127049]|uniref:hypothetical protein n=1 Tax=Streptomyces sp. NPDC127049 TaxID=3347118 RepID=UPI003658B220
MTGLRRTAGAVAVTLASAALGAALVLLAGLAYQLVDGDVTRPMVAWILGLLLAAVLLFGAFGGTLPDDPAGAADGPDGGSGGAPDDGSGAPEGDWYDVLVFGLVLLGLVAGGPLGIAGYEALRPERPPAVAPAPPSTPVSASTSPSAAPPAPGVR